jgi:hypothetical protein
MRRKIFPAMDKMIEGADSAIHVQSHRHMDLFFLPYEDILFIRFLPRIN